MKFARAFYTRPTLEVAKDLLGKYLVFKNMSGKISEVEAYIGQDDQACHASHGKTKRNEVMFKKGGFAYIYIIYGLYHCLNITTEKEGFPSAILIRALEHPKATGPGKLCRYFDITRKQNGLDLTRSQMYIEDRHVRISPKNIIATPRIGVDYAGGDAQLPWRFLIK